jgi:predicted DNA-binding protein (MmcQ/YjbR family)
MPGMGNTARLEEIATALPGAERVDVWGGDLNFQVRGRNFVFSNGDASEVSLKLPLEEAAAVTASDPAVVAAPALGKHGWVVVTLGPDEDEQRWRRIEDWVRSSYVLIAPGTLAQQVDAGRG